MTYKPTALILSAITFLGVACRQPQKTLFVPVTASQSHIDFKNTITEDENFNILTYEYLYNGGGIATGDVNNDGLPDIFFTGNMVPNKLYLNKGNLTFTDISAQAHTEGRRRWKTGAVMADVNGDGLLDIYVCYSGPGTDDDRRNELYINNGVINGVPSFSEMAKEYGLDAPGTFSTTATFFDMDNDGDLDMFLVNHGDMFFNPYFNTEKLRATRHPKFGNRLYRNDNNKFTEVSEQAGINGSGLNFGLNASVSDINNDGFADIYVTNDYDERDFLYINNHNGTFKEVLNQAAGHLSLFAMGSDIADYNNDLKPDLMVMDMLPPDNYRQKLLKGQDKYDKYMLRVNNGFGHQQMRNTLQVNNGNDSAGVPIFSEMGQFAGVQATDWSWAPLFADFDNDGWKDLFISNGIFRDVTSLDFVNYTSGYSNKFTDEKTDKPAMWQLVQKMPSTPLKNFFFHNNRDLTFSDVSDSWGLNKKTTSTGSAYADLDNDGDLDMIINCINDEPILLQNTTNNTTSHYLRIKFNGSGANTQGIGAKVYVTSPHTSQMQEQYLSRGFQSSVDPVMHIGLGVDSVASTVKIVWVDGKENVFNNVKANALLTVEQAKAVAATDTAATKQQPLFSDATAASGLNYVHHAPSFVDFKISPLLPFQVSKIGPSLVTGDVNGDGLDDLFVGGSGSANQAGMLFLQQKNGSFLPSLQQPWMQDKNITSVDAILFDADNDGDKDLYIVSGGADSYLNSPYYQDKLYENDGKGDFHFAEGALPAETISGGCVKVADIDKDGKPDLFVGGKLKPGFFPEAPESFILKNKSVPGKILFVKDDQQKDTLLNHPGMVSDAVWTDLNKDGWPDLVVVGLFMPVTVFENNHGQLVNKTEAYGCANSNGWWTRVTAADINNDGYPDIIGGNIGENFQLHATQAEPITLLYSNFSGNDIRQTVLCYYYDGKMYPWYSRDELASQVPLLNKRFLKYEAYANADINDIFSDEQLSKAGKLTITIQASSCFMNNGKKHFDIKPLPNMAQISMLNGIVATDINNDGSIDLVTAGNFYPFRAEQGPMDASIGLYLKGDGKGNFTPQQYAATGLCIRGDVRNLAALTVNGKKVIVAAKSNAAIQAVQIDGAAIKNR